MCTKRSPRLGMLLALVAGAACSDQGADPLTPSPPAVLANNQAADQQDIPTVAEEHPGSWMTLSDETLWEYIAIADSTATVGLRAPGAKRGFYRGKVLVNSSQQDEARRAVLAQQGVVLVSTDTLLPRMRVKLANIDALRAIRKLPFVYYIEPVKVRGSGAQAWADGCGQEQFSGTRHYLNGDVVSESFIRTRIPDAWRRSTGEGVTVGLTDAGIHPNTPELGQYFTSGESGGRSIQHFDEFRDNINFTWPGECEHGTKMAGLIAGPKNGRNIVGVAWKANLISVRHADEVHTVNATNAAQGIRTAAQNMIYSQGGKIITMAWQSANLFYEVEEEIEYWYYNFDILFIGAAGTSGPNDPLLNGNVVFPADQPEVFAVTGVDPSGIVCERCHNGSPVQVSAYITHATTEHGGDGIVSISFSSSAAAVVGGVAALVWSHYPWMNRNQVANQLRYAGSSYPYKHSKSGYGAINAFKAVGGLVSIGVNAPATVKPYATIVVDAVVNGDGPFTYRWGNGATTASATYRAGSAPGPLYVSLWVTDTTDGTTLHASATIPVEQHITRPPTCDPNVELC